MNATQRTICASLVLAMTACGGQLRAEEPSREFALGVNAANATLRGGDVEGAIKQYGEMRSAAPESADLSYNMAVAQFRKGEVAAAAPLFEAAAASENDTLAANARYNLGNCNYTAGLELAESDRNGAIKELESAIDNYRSSLSVDTNNADARANIELASQLIDKLREEQKQQEQQQQQDQRDQQQSNDEQQDDQQQQSSQGKQDEEQQNEKEQNQDQQQQEPKDQQQSGDEQQKDQEQQDQKQQDSQSQSSQNDKEQEPQQEQQQQEQTSDQEQNADQQNQQSPQDQQKQQQQSQSAQQQQQQPQDAGNPEEQKPEQQDKKPPQGELSAANEEDKQGEEKQQAVAFDPAKDGEMTQQEAEKMLQAIRDRDLLRRYQRQRNEQQNYVPVDRDW